MNVFNCNLNIGNEVHSLVHFSSEFQTAGATEVTAPVFLFLRVSGTTNCVVSDANCNTRAATRGQAAYLGMLADESGRQV